MGVLSVRALLFRVYSRACEFWKLPHRGHAGQGLLISGFFSEGAQGVEDEAVWQGV